MPSASTTRMGCDPIRFDSRELKLRNGDKAMVRVPTAITLWQDGKLYIGQQTGQVNVISYNARTLVVNSQCTSEILTDSRFKTESGMLSTRAILGITFDPRDKVARPYVSVSTILWGRRGNINPSNRRAWSNGAVVRLRPATQATRAKNPTQCLQLDRSIIRNLPVSNDAHAINEMVFTQNGDLLIAVGGFTNLGLPFLRLGGIWDTFFSSSVLIARLSKGSSFNGNIPYTTPENLRTARPRKGYTDVELYATGVRNLFAMSMSRSGKIFALDQGPTCNNGNFSTSCDEYVESEAAMRNMSSDEPFPGRVKLQSDDPECNYSADRPDPLIEVKQGKWYGHPNLQRARITGADYECAWVDPLTGRSPSPSFPQPPPNYEAPLAQVPSAKTGLREYGSNAFCGALRGDLILAHFQIGGVTRLKVSRNGAINPVETPLQEGGGIRVEENSQGDLFFPQFPRMSGNGIFVMRPKMTKTKSLFLSNAVPFRHGRKGGTILRVGGSGFTKKMTIKVGGRPCRSVRRSSTEVLCRVPAFRGGRNAVAVQVSIGRVTRKLREAVLYMNV